jgi:alkanesulfonate monooxygenase SsuD/methylene tetrahydromethanopterin reductase-like flavin-dependent oxidoreductase (luciferase family)
MEIGISLLNNWGVEDVHVIVQLAVRAEALGFASVWVHDHASMPATCSAALGTGRITSL